MAIIEYKTGTKLVSTTEWSLTNDSAIVATDVTDGVFQLFADMNAMAAGDQFDVTVYEKTRSADTQRIVWVANIIDAQSEPVFVSPPLTLMNGWDMTLTKISGTDRTITWSIRQVA